MFSSPTPESEVEWNRGRVMASAQNFARELKEAPSNLLTPSLFVEVVGERLGQLGAGERLEFIPRSVSNSNSNPDTVWGQVKVS